MSEKDNPLTEAFFYILLSLRHLNHGYGIIQEVEELTKGRVSLGAGTLYGALQTMQKRGWIRVVSQETESRKKKGAACGTAWKCGPDGPRMRRWML